MTMTTMEFTEEKLQLLKNTICKEITNDELEHFMHVCTRTGLDPFRNQIYAVKRAGKMTIQTAIDGFRLIAERTGKYSPGKEPSFTYDAQGKLQSATSFVKKQTADGTWHDVSATAFWAEFVQSYNGKPSNFWAKMPHVMLAKCAESAALRKAFPADMSGIYTTEEMAQADTNVVDVTPTAPQPEMIEVPDLNEVEMIEEVSMICDQDNRLAFIEWVEEIKNAKKMTYRKIIDYCKSNPEKTKETFLIWQGQKAGI